MASALAAYKKPGNCKKTIPFKISQKSFENSYLASFRRVDSKSLLQYVTLNTDLYNVDSLIPSFIQKKEIQPRDEEKIGNKC